MWADYAECGISLSWYHFAQIHGCGDSKVKHGLLVYGHMSLKRTATNFFLALKYLAPCQPLVTVILPILLATLLATGPIMLRPSEALLPASEAFSPTNQWGHCTQLWSAICNHSSEALLPTSEAFLEPTLGAHARCEVCTILRDDHTMTPPPPKTPYM